MVTPLETLPANKAERLKNRTCFYCGEEFSEKVVSTVEHVIARRFVPKGSLHQSWNLIGNACQVCNGRKADLENDISAITIQPALGERHTDPGLNIEANRKAARSVSRSTKKPVGKSQVEHTVKGTLMGSAQIAFNLVGPPQLDKDRVHELAYLHLQGFFYRMSYDSEERRGYFLPGTVGFVGRASRNDWGNPLMRSFTDRVASWPLQFDCVCAGGFYKVRIRRETEDSAVWAFALEWNQSLRIIGFFGDLGLAQGHLDALKPLQWRPWDGTSRFRRQTPLAPEDDHLFSSE